MKTNEELVNLVNRAKEDTQVMSVKSVLKRCITELESDDYISALESLTNALIWEDIRNENNVSLILDIKRKIRKQC